MNQLAVDMIKKFEGFKSHAYQDSGGLWTAGFGWTHGVTMDTVMTKEQAEANLIERVEEIQKQVDMLVKFPLSRNQEAALISFVYNVGIDNFKNSTMLKKINEAYIEEAGKEFLKWCHVKGQFIEGLLLRRRAERAIFNSPTIGSIS